MDYQFLRGTVMPVPEPPATMPTAHLPWCFGCGPENEHGLGLHPRLEGDKVTADIEFAPWFQGGPGVVHGGATAAFFDDLMGFVLLAHETPGVTAKLEVNYLRPITLGQVLRGEAWLAAVEGRKLWVEAEGLDQRGDRYVEATALFLAVGLEHFTETIEAMTPGQRERAMRYRDEEYYP